MLLCVKYIFKDFFMYKLTCTYCNVSYETQYNKGRKYCSDKCCFLSKINIKDDSNECWEWTAALDRDGYGVYGFIRAHRKSYEIHNGEITNNLYVLHSCDNRKCCNPNHLRLGTPKDNSDDAYKRKRRKIGSQLKHSKLTEEDVRYIRYTSTETGSELARKYNIAKQQISCIRRGKTWKHV